MHHRAQLMVYERMLGIVPHLTRRRAASAAPRRLAAAGHLLVVDQDDQIVAVRPASGRASCRAG